MKCLIFFVSILLTSVFCQGAEIYSISNTNCSIAIKEKFGLTARNLCFEKNKLFICNRKTPPFGAELPDSFLLELGISKSNFASSLPVKCKVIKKQEEKARPVSEQCSVSNSLLFKPLIEGLGLPLSSCFCKSGGLPVLSSCVEVDGQFKSTATFDNKRIISVLKNICDKKIGDQFKTACFCNKHYGSENNKEYIGCLKDMTTRQSSSQPVLIEDEEKTQSAN